MVFHLISIQRYCMVSVIYLNLTLIPHPQIITKIIFRIDKIWNYSAYVLSPLPTVRTSRRRSLASTFPRQTYRTKTLLVGRLVRRSHEHKSYLFSVLKEKVIYSCATDMSKTNSFFGWVKWKTCSIIFYVKE